ncbi:MAG TPA: histidine--tRNA ligase [Elusimicrobia bacterium]|nr:histidine--tRNA ligase [Elusimicrobiota bacterium]
MIHSLRGFRDILPPDSERFTAIEAAAREVFSLYGYHEIRIPTLEARELFVKSTGDTTDIVQKEMYAFTDQGGREIAARPEGTPGVVRAYIENNLAQSGGNGKFFYIGSMFRAERPQAGRYREFEQIGAECIGAHSPFADAESISLLMEILSKAGVSGCLAELNSLGCAECRAAYRAELLAYLKANTAALCPACQARLERNPLRALDCKLDGPRLALAAPCVKLCPNCLDHFSRVQELLSSSNAQFRINKSLVRGLDYYTRTVFEVKTGALGSQDAIAGGGRYDDLVKSMSGPDAPAVGWALGVDRLALLTKDAAATPAATQVFVICAQPAGVEASAKAFALLGELRAAGIRTDFSDFGLSLKSQLRSADKSGASLALILGEEEVKNSVYTLKFLKEKKDQRTVPAAGITPVIRAALSQ